MLMAANIRLQSPRLARGIVITLYIKAGPGLWRINRQVRRDVLINQGARKSPDCTSDISKVSPAIALPPMASILKSARSWEGGA